jgi:thiol-disulfide isomerase/thioredoxin
MFAGKLTTFAHCVLLCGVLATTGMQVHAAGKVELALPDLNGKVRTLAEFEGKWVIVNYWATSCPPCLKEIPELQSFYERHKDRDAVVLGVNFEDIKPSWLQAFVDSVSMDYPVLRSTPDPQTPFGLILVLPTTFVIAPGGELVARQSGPVTAASLDAYLQRKRAALPTATAPSTATGAEKR